MSTIKVHLTENQKKKLLKAIGNPPNKIISFKIPAKNMKGEFPLTVSKDMADRHEINSREKKGMILRICPSELEQMKGEGFSSIFTKPLSAVIKTGIEGIKQGLDKDRTGRGSDTFICSHCNGSGLLKKRPIDDSSLSVSKEIIF